MMTLSSVWNEEEDDKLRQLVEEYGPKKWSLIATKLKTKGSKQCRRRWKNYLNADLKKGGWTPEEDDILLEGHKKYGNRWTEIAKLVGGRTDNAVKNRWAALCKRNQKLSRSTHPSSTRRRRPGLKLIDSPSTSLSPRRATRTALAARRVIEKSSPRTRSIARATGMKPEPHVPSPLARQISMKKPELSITIPNAAGSEPQPPTAQSVGLEIRVFKDLLTPCEIQYAKELNDMDIPLQINIDDDPPLSTSRRAAEDAIIALASPGEAPLPDFTDVLKLFQTGLTPHSTGGAPSSTSYFFHTPKGRCGTPRLSTPQNSSTPRTGTPRLGEVHQGHRQLLSKLLTGCKAASEDASIAEQASGFIGTASQNCQPYLPTSSGASFPSSCTVLSTCTYYTPTPQYHRSEVLMSPNFSQTELSMLLDALNSEDMHV